mmetsp:Transcript_37928/g.95337  ORF Transcript_37928/g.95337 Transcript_37928/m.95337 type:complete len:1284 (+) Transcript_37928:114-3965(+)
MKQSKKVLESRNASNRKRTSTSGSSGSHRREKESEEQKKPNSVVSLDSPVQLLSTGPLVAEQLKVKSYENSVFESLSEKGGRGMSDALNRLCRMQPHVLANESVPSFHPTSTTSSAYPTGSVSAPYTPMGSFTGTVPPGVRPVPFSPAISMPAAKVSADGQAAFDPKKNTKGFLSFISNEGSDSPAVTQVANQVVSPMASGVHHRPSDDASENTHRVAFIKFLAKIGKLFPLPNRLRPMSRASDAAIEHHMCTPIGNCVYYVLLQTQARPGATDVCALLDMDLVLMTYEAVSPHLSKKSPYALEVLSVAIVKWLRTDMAGILPSHILNYAETEIAQGRYLQSGTSTGLFDNARSILMDELISALEHACPVSLDASALKKAGRRLKQVASKKPKDKEENFLSLVNARTRAGWLVRMALNPQKDPRYHLAACQSGNLAAIRGAKDHLDLQWTDEQMNTLLHHACRSGHIEVVQELLRLPMPVNSRNVAQMSPLDESCKLGNVRMAACLLEHGASISCQIQMTEPALSTRQSSSSESATDTSKLTGSKDNKRPMTTIDLAAVSGNWDMIALLAAHGHLVPARYMAETSKQTTVNLSGCLLKTLSPTLGHAFKGMTCLDIRNNDIAVFDSVWLAGLPSLNKVMLTGNPVVDIAPILVGLCTNAPSAMTTHVNLSMAASLAMTRSRTRNADGSALLRRQRDSKMLQRSTSTSDVNAMCNLSSRDRQPLKRCPSLSSLVPHMSTGLESLKVHSVVVEWLEWWFGCVPACEDTAAEEIDAFVALHETVVNTTPLVSYLVKRLWSAASVAKVVSAVGGVAGASSQSVVVANRLASLLYKLFVWCRARKDSLLHVFMLLQHCRSLGAAFPFLVDALHIHDINAMTRSAPIHATRFSGGMPMRMPALTCPPPVGVPAPDQRVRLFLGDVDASVVPALPEPADLLINSLIPTRAIANCICHYQYGIFCDIPSSEWVGKRCFQRSTSPAYHRLVDSNKSLTCWVIEAVLCSTDLLQRLTVIERAVEIAELCRSASNYMGMCGIISGMQSFPVHRLQLTMRFIPDSTRRLLDSMQELLSFDRNFINYRNVRSRLRSPAIPLLFPEVRDLLYLEEQDSLRPCLNITKFVNVHKVIKGVEHCRVQPPNQDDLQAAQNVLHSLFNKRFSLSQAEQDLVSCEIEPRMTPEEKKHLGMSFHQQLLIKRLMGALVQAQASQTMLQDAIMEDLRCRQRATHLSASVADACAGPALTDNPSLATPMASLVHSLDVIKATSTLALNEALGLQVPAQSPAGAVARK